MTLHPEFSPGIGIATVPTEEPAAPAEPAEKPKQREGLLGQVEQLQQETAQGDLEPYWRTVSEYVAGKLDDPAVIQQALKQSGKSLDDFEADVATCRHYHELCTVLAGSASLAAEEQTLATAAEKAAAAVDAAHADVAKAKAKLVAAQAESQRCDDAVFAHGQTMADLSSAMSELTTAPELVVFMPDGVRELRARVVELTEQRNAAKARRDKAKSKAMVVRGEQKASRGRLAYLQSMDYLACKPALLGEEMAERQKRDGEEIGAIQGKLLTIEQQLQSCAAAASKAEEHAERLDGELREAQAKLLESLSGAE